MTKIDKKIVSYNVVDNRPEVQHMHESLKRPDLLSGTTYKVKTPLSDHALYITINDVLLNPNTPDEHRRPFEIFINSKAMDHFQWIVALTRIISAVFRKGGEVTFLVEELRSVFDPKGGYFKKGGKYMPSLVAEIGDVIEAHLRTTGIMKIPALDTHQQQLVREYRGKAGDPEDSDFPPDAQLCGKCQTKAVVVMDGCLTCLNCADSKCG
jgi:hypothetical protein